MFSRHRMALLLTSPYGSAFKTTVHGSWTTYGCLEILTGPARVVTTDYGRFAYGCSQARKASARARTVHVCRVDQDQDQDSLLVKRRNDNHSPGPVIRELVPSSHQRSELSNTILCIFSR